jgi:hypothetical protein
MLYDTRMKLTSTHFFIVLIIIVIGGIGAAKYFAEPEIASGAYDEFAQCVADSGATFFGAFWCPHCNEQKRMFGDSVRLLPYTECSTPDKQGQTQICIDEGIKSYPTWEFNDVKREGVLQLTDIATETGCVLPTLTE